jgi:tRNA(Arg) A34 adenosine deaminase TadA
MPNETVPTNAILRAYEAAKATQGIKRYKLGACLYDKRGRIINAKGNLRKTHPALLRFTEHPYLHAETHCVVSHGLDNCDGLRLFVLRLDASGQPTMAKPCDVCLSIGRLVGLSSIGYTDWKGEVQFV